MKRQKPIWHLGTLSASCIMAVLLATYISFRIENRAIADMSRDALDTVLSKSSIEESQPFQFPEMTNSRQYRYTLLDLQGTVIDQTGAELNPPDSQSPEVIQARRTGEGFDVRYNKSDKTHIYALARRLPSGKRIIHIQTASSLQWHLRNKGLILLFMLIILIAFVTAILNSLFTKRFSRPLEVMEIGVAEFSSGNFEHRIYVDRKSNLFRLTRTMNKMAVQLDDRIKTIQQQSNELEAILNGMIEPVVVLNGYLVVLRYNSAAAVLIGKSPEAAVGHYILDVYRNTKVYDFAKRTKESRSFQEAVIRVNEFEKTKGEIITGPPPLRILQVYGVCIHDDQEEEATRIIIVFNDVTRLKRLEGIRKDFVANVSHELKTPVATIQGFVETLIEGIPANPAQLSVSGSQTDASIPNSATLNTETMLRYLGIIREHSLRLNLIIEDLLSLSRMEQNEYEIQLTEVSIAALAAEAMSSCSIVAKEKGTQIHNKIPHEIQLTCDEGLVRQALVNLVDNAVKYSPDDSHVSIEYEQGSENHIISVFDDGSPIPEQARERIFERFYRMDMARSRKLAGTGLGLSIVKHIMMIHKGEVRLVSSPSGNRFLLSFPMSAA